MPMNFNEITDLANFRKPYLGKTGQIPETKTELTVKQQYCDRLSLNNHKNLMPALSNRHLHQLQLFNKIIVKEETI